MKLKIMHLVEVNNDDEYLVANVTEYNNKDYYLLVNYDDDSDIMIAYVDDSKFIPVSDSNEYVKILQTFDTNNYSIDELYDLADYLETTDD